MVTQFGARLTELIERDLAEMHDDRFVLTRNGRLLADGIASELFVVK
jgi:coproporphyrinogen III oxidase-like Fe-S oxidoreductase